MPRAAVVFRLALAAAALALLATACTRDTGMEPAPDLRPRPQPGGAVVVGMVGEPATLDPYSPEASDLTRALARPLYPSLFRFDPDGEVAADVADSLEERDGEARVTLGDRPWSTGRALTARDVVASARRARPPSGFAGLRARAIDRRTVALSGPVDDWEQTLARATFVLPRGRARPERVTGGPFRLVERTPGLELVYEPDAAWEGEGPFLERVTVTFVESDSLLLDLLEAEEIDVAVTPVAVNLEQRLAERGVAFEAASGWDALVLDFDPSVARPVRLGVWHNLDREHLQEGLIREAGRVVDTLRPGPGETAGPFVDVPGGEGRARGRLRIAGDRSEELSRLLQRALHRQLQGAGFDVELVAVSPRVLYGEWMEEMPADAAIRRRAGAPGLSDPPGATARLPALPLFGLDSFIAMRDGIHGIRANPTLEGPLWNLHEWWVEEGGDGRIGSLGIEAPLL